MVQLDTFGDLLLCLYTAPLPMLDTHNRMT